MGTSLELSATPYILTLQTGNGSHALVQDHGALAMCLQLSVTSQTHGLWRGTSGLTFPRCALSTDLHHSVPF